MRLPPPLIEQIARGLVRSLLEKGLIASDHPDRTREKVARLIAADLKIEDEITEEARQILVGYQGIMRDDEEMEYHRVLARVKGEVAAKRKYVLP